MSGSRQKVCGALLLSPLLTLCLATSPSQGGLDHPYGLGFVAGAFALDDDALRGPQLGYGVYWREALSRTGLWLSHQSHGDQRSTGLRADASFMPWVRHWGGIAPLFAVGAEQRSKPSHHGSGGFVGAGIEFHLRLHGPWWITIGGERDFGLSSPTRNQLRFSVAFMHERLAPDADDRP